MMIAAFSLSACSSGDDDNNSVNPLIITKRLSKVTKTSGGNHYDEYLYDSQGRLTQAKSHYYYMDQEHISVNSTYTYENNSIIATEFYSETISWQDIYTLENGRIIKYVDGDGDSNETMFNYDNGYLTLQTESDGHQYKYIWRDGCLMEVYDRNYLYDTYEYSNYPCPQGFFPFGHVHLCRYWGMSGYFGKTMKYLPSKYSGGGILIEYEWTIKDGLPIKMIENIKEAPTKGTYTYTFEWK